MVDFKNGYYQTVFYDGKLAHVKVVFEQQKGPGQGVAFSEAEAVAKTFLLKDIKPVKQFQKDLAPAVGKAYI